VFTVNQSYDSLDHAKSWTYPDTASFGGAATVPRNTLTATLDSYGSTTSLADSFAPILNSVTYNANGMLKIWFTGVAPQQSHFDG